MKKLIKPLITVLSIVSYTVFMTACGGSDDSNIESNKLYIADGQQSPGNLYLVDPGNGNVTTIGPIMVNGTNVCVTAMTIMNDILYAVTCDFQDTGGDPNNLITINPKTAEATVVGPAVDTNGDEAVIAAMTNLNGVLYAWNDEGSTSNDDALYQMNASTGELTLIGDAGICGAGSGIAVDNAGNMYFMGCSDLHLINPADGTSINEIGTNGDAINIAWCNGAMWGVTTSDANLANAQIGTLDLTTSNFTAVYDASGEMQSPDAMACKF